MSPPPWPGEAPGRLDVLGGVADYSGSLVLQTPIRATTRVSISPTAEPRLLVASDQEGTVELPSPDFDAVVPPSGEVAPLVAWLDSHDVPRWARYPLGCLFLFRRAQGWRPDGGLFIEITTNVPASMGVSSSAALEVATLRALEAASGRRFEGTDLARLAQRAENEVVGAPCGLMDQLAAAHGVPGALLPILCRPDVLREPVLLPEGAIVAGWPSGVKHAVSGREYGEARAASFMGKRILEAALGRRLGHVTELPPSVVGGTSADVLPSSMTGAEFIARHGRIDDPHSAVVPDRRYPVRAGVEFPVGENHRCDLAERLLRVGGADPAGTLRTVGELMFQSHLGYGSIGLGRPETDAMVEAVRGLGPARGFYGARASGGGCGGTVAVLLEASSLPELHRLAERAGTPALIL
jgi:L-arabinokinase